MNITPALIEQFKAIAGDECSTDDAERYLRMSKGSVEMGLNYFYNRREKDVKKNTPDNKAKTDAFSFLKEGSKRQHQLEKVIKEVRKNYYQPVIPTPTKDEAPPMMADDLMVTTDISANLERIKELMKKSKFSKDFTTEDKIDNTSIDLREARSLITGQNIKFTENLDYNGYNFEEEARVAVRTNSNSASVVKQEDIQLREEVDGVKYEQFDSSSVDREVLETPQKLSRLENGKSSVKMDQSISEILDEEDQSISASALSDLPPAKLRENQWASQPPPPKRNYFAFEQQREEEMKSKLEAESEWPKLLGEMTISAFVIMTLSHKVRTGDPVILAREKQTLNAFKKTKKEQKKTATASVIRVVHEDQEIGKLENVFAVMLGPLLDKNYVFLDCELQNPPSDWNYFSPFTLRAKVYLAEDVITKPITKVFSTKETIKGQEETTLAKMEGTREAFIALFDKLNLRRLTDTLVQRQPPTKSETGLQSSTSTKPKMSFRTNAPFNSSMDIESDNTKSMPISNETSQDVPKSTAPAIKRNDIFDKVPKQTSLAAFQIKKAPKPADSEPVASAEKSQQETTPSADGDQVDQVVQNETNDIDYTKLLNLENPDKEDLKLSEPPASCTASLHEYQKQALTWMLTREGQLNNMYNAFNEKSRVLHALWEEYEAPDSTRLYFNPYTGQVSVEIPRASPDCKGGILADEMGLGKTVMMIALIHSHRRNTKNGSIKSITSTDATQDDDYVQEPKPKQIKLANGAFTKPDSTSNKIKAGTLVVLPLTLLAQWESEIEIHSKQGSVSVYLYYGNTRSARGVNLSQYDVVLTTYGIVSSEFTSTSRDLYRYEWFRLVLDEAHYIKGRTIQIAKAVYELTGVHKWCLSGTPVQNKLDDLFSLIHYLKLEPWSDYVWWNNYINKPNEQNDPIVFKILGTILQPILLRRTKKTQQANGALLIELPERVQKIEYIELSKGERDIYDALYRKSKTEFDSYIAQGTVLTNYIHVLEILLRLRQVCDHPFLIFTRKDVASKEQMEPAIHKFLEKYDITANESIYPKNPLEKLDIHDHFEIIIDEETQEERKVEIKKSAKVANPDFVREQIERLRKGEGLENCSVCLSEVEDAVITVCAHIACRDCLIRAIEASSMCPVCRHILTRRDFMTVPRDNRFSVDINQKYKPSSKLEALGRHIEDVLSKKDKCIVFSQWVSMLDLVEHDLKTRNIAFVRLDGSMSQKKRQETLHQFKTDASFGVFLISLKAGGVGLNLTAANHVFLIDPWWNPAVEDQAVERVHRIGQKKNVEIIRFICRQTVEERIIELHQHKKQLFDSTISRNQEEKKAMNLENFKYLMQNY